MLRLHDTLTGSTRDFEPLSPPSAGVYVCGPTVYGDSHLGHAKSYVSFDVLVRFMRHEGYRVRYVQNITDVGHLSENSETGDDKLQRQARLERLEPMEIAEKYTRSYFEDMDRLGNLRPDISPRASGHIPEQIELVRALIEKGHAYQAGGNVYFSVRSFPGYGRLSGRRPDDLVAGARVEVQADKRDPLDFALWKEADAGHILKWRSPWGWGFPGWHLECSAMAMRYLGETIDIHGGGLENVFPHHESEIAQSEAATGRQFARFWLHNNMVTIDGQKMGKSLGNARSLKEMFERYEPMTIRLYILRSHYRSPLDFSDEGLSSAASALGRIRDLASRLGPSDPGSPPPGSALQFVEEAATAFTGRLSDDLDTPGAVAVLFEYVRKCNQALETGVEPGQRAAMSGGLSLMACELLGLSARAASGSSDTEPLLLGLLSEYRSMLRERKLFAEADGMRDALAAGGYSVKDMPGGRSLIERISRAL
ncbi:MAG: cysteine--tRNA ligase [Candidatus Fermentibacter sp.]|nr:cysteine--tRNA ligase [Candidatus Fermentibacter sp.]